MNLPEVEGIGCRRGTQVQKLKQKELGSKELGCGADLTRATELVIYCIAYGEMTGYDVFYYAKLI